MVGKFNPDLNPEGGTTPRRRAHDEHGDDPVRVAVLAGGRSSEHDVSLDSAASVREGLTAGRPRRLVGRPRARRQLVVRGRGGGAARRRRAAGRRRGLPGPARALRRGRHRAGAARAARRRPTSARACWPARCAWTRSSSRTSWAAPGLPQVAYWSLDGTRGRGPGRSVGGRATRAGSSRRGWARRSGIARVDAPSELEAAIEAAAAHDPRVIVEASARGIEVECSVLGPTDAPQASQPGEILLAGGEGGWYDYEAKYTPGGMELVVPARIPDAARERVRELAVHRLPPGGLQRAGARGLLRRRRGRAAQRAQHHARLHADERLRQALGPQRRALSRAVRPPGADRDRALRARTPTPVLGTWSAGALSACHAGYDVTHRLHRCTEFPCQTTRHVGDRDVVGELHQHTPHRRLGRPRPRTGGVRAVPDMNGAQIRTIER